MRDISLSCANIRGQAKPNRRTTKRISQRAASGSYKSSRQDPSVRFIIVWKSSELYRTAGFLFMVGLNRNTGRKLLPGLLLRICSRTVSKFRVLEHRRTVVRAAIHSYFSLIILC